MPINLGQLAYGFSKRRDEQRREDRDSELQRREGISKELSRLLDDPNTTEEVKSNISSELSRLTQFPIEDAQGFVKPYKYDAKMLVPSHHKPPDDLSREADKRR